MCFCIITDAPRFHSSNTFTARPTYPALKASEARCTLYMVDPYMVDESKPHEPHPVCEMFPEYEDGVEGIAYTIDGVADDFYDDVDFAATTVYFSDVTMEAEGGLHGGGKLTPNAGSTVTKDSSQGGVRGRRSNRRRLAPTTGTSSLLIVYSKPPDASNSKTPAIGTWWPVQLGPRSVVTVVAASAAAALPTMKSSSAAVYRHSAAARHHHRLMWVRCPPGSPQSTSEPLSTVAASDSTSSSSSVGRGGAARRSHRDPTWAAPASARFRSPPPIHASPLAVAATARALSAPSARAVADVGPVGGL